ncbi:MAG: OPT/YSL family transporter [Acidobacteria bacterium]|nr:OPT/YSL family transporter [Acidobacteriota bacterium]
MRASLPARRAGRGRLVGRGSATLGPAPVTHPRTFAPALFVPLVAISAAGAVIGVQLLTSLGVTPNTALIGALIAMLLGRLPVAGLRVFRSMHAQNLAQSAMSAATFGAANSLLLPIGVPYLLGREDLVLPLLAGVAGAMFLDAWILYRLFGSRIFPAEGAWPPGLAAAEAIRAGDAGGRQALVLVSSLAAGALGAWLSLPMSAFGTAFIGNAWALTMFGVGLLASGYSVAVAGVSLQALYVPHGMMIGAGLVALGQVVAQLRQTPEAGAREDAVSRAADARVGATLRAGGVGYLAIAAGLALAGGLHASMAPGPLVLFVVYAALAAYVHELLVGLAAMHSGWFPAFAVALITLLVGMSLGFPPTALAILTGFSVATGPAFADMGYDLKAGFVLRGRGTDAAFELDGRRQQFLAASVAFATALVVVLLTWRGYFAAGLVPPVAKVYVATISAGVAPGVAGSLLLWAIPGGLLQLSGGSRRQLGVLLSTGLLIANPIAGWGVLAGIAVRFVWARVLARPAGALEVVAAGFIAGDALWSFGDAVTRPRARGGA